MTQQHYLEVSQEAGAAFFSKNITGPVTMLNLLRFRDEADYTENPQLRPEHAITGAEAFQKYIDHTLPLLKKSGGELLFLGKGAHFLIGPMEEKWDMMMLVKQNSTADFMAFASDPEYLAGLGHRTAALLDSRLLPLVEK